MARLIDANTLKRLTCEWCNKTRPEEPCEPEECAIMWFYDGQPTVDAMPVVHGRWEDFCRGKMCCCSACKAEFDNTCNEIHGEWKFCPNCGAKMDK